MLAAVGIARDNSNVTAGPEIKLKGDREHDVVPNQSSKDCTNGKLENAKSRELIQDKGAQKSKENGGRKEGHKGNSQGDQEGYEARPATSAI